MSEALTLLDGSLPKNPHVKIQQKGHGWIALSSLDAQPEPVNLSELKSEILKRWPMISLLDMLKETDLRTDFSKAFKSATFRLSAALCRGVCKWSTLSLKKSGLVHDLTEIDTKSANAQEKSLFRETAL